MANATKAAHQRHHRMKVKMTVSDYVIVILMAVIMLVVFVATLYPFLNSLAISLNYADDTMLGGITIYPRKFTLDNYKNIFTKETIWKPTASPLPVPSWHHRRPAHHRLPVLRPLPEEPGRPGRVHHAVPDPHVLRGRLIPSYFLIRTLGLTNTFWVYIIPNLVNVWNMILMRSYFQSVPEALEESARIDGANYLTIFWKIYWPVSTPIIATIALYFGVFHWNDWYTTFVYITDSDLKPMTSVLLSIINEASFAERMAAQGADAAVIGQAAQGKAVNVRSITMPP